MKKPWIFKPTVRNTLTSAFAGLLLAGCATQPVLNANPQDPWEASNRSVYAFNDAIDRAVFKPAAEAYAFITPQPVRTCINNIFLNLGEVWSFINSSIQGRHEDALNTMGRFLLNSTMGIGGCFDLASMNGAKRISNDFGVTLGVWGISSGPYMVLPILGGTTLRDGTGKIPDLYFNQYGYGQLVHNVDVRNSIYGFEIVERREALLDVTNMVDRTAPDPYSFIRDAYLKKRAAQIRGNTGEAEKLPNYEDFEDVPADKEALGIPEKK
jgi:phospholipid-binding lipoprotein MlaA